MYYLEKINPSYELPDLPDSPLLQLCSIWENSVRATHTFLSEQDIAQIKPFVKAALTATPIWIISQIITHPAPLKQILAFMEADQDKIEMLFVDPLYFRNKLGTKLVQYGLNELQIKYVDVNEQNPAALKFYENLNFEVYKRSPQDGQGRPFPILHLKQKFY